MGSSADDTSFSVFKQDGSHQFYCRWSLEEDMLLSKAVADHGPHKWTTVAQCIPGRTAVQCSTRWFGALNPNVHKGRWSKHEDKALSEAVEYYQFITKDTALPWNRIAENIPHRTGIQCQARWTEALDPAVRKGRWLLSEDKLLEKAIQRYGCCWIRVASIIPTRTQRQCRTRWNQIHTQHMKSASNKPNKIYSPPPPPPLPPVNDPTPPPPSSTAALDFYLPTDDKSMDDLLAQYAMSSRTSSLSSYSPHLENNTAYMNDPFRVESTSCWGMQDPLDLQGFLSTSSNNNLFQSKEFTLGHNGEDNFVDGLLTVHDFEFLLDL
ncbi:Homeodomain-like protein [Mucor mucedo]|uniref:Homeodomain-like protein n=1 Tax=Mucor mucedo TaxID=29922 RepID=UPI00221FAB79|nr:Homeodomain-like protein [Mucor mucedo]KAI7888605.1 Homeodomain-like protein [Mucor mucedo]